MKLKTMTDAQLHRLVDSAKGELIHRASIVALRTKIQTMLKDAGITTINELAKGKKYKVAPKWRHKEDKSLTWAGRGRQPKWIKKYGVKI